MAAIQSILLRTEDNYEQQFAHELRATYTFGQPMVGAPELAEACDTNDEFLRERVRLAPAWISAGRERVQPRQLRPRGPGIAR